MRSVLLVAILGIAGCIDGASLDDVAIDQSMGPVGDAYYDVAPPQRSTAEHNARYVAAGAGGGEVRFHTFEDVEAKLAAWNATYPDLVDVEIIGESRLGHPIYLVVVTDESVPQDGKVAPLFDGGHHGNEYAGSELTLYTVDLLLENYATNATVRQLLRDNDIHVVPVVNPDGYIRGTRHNGQGVNLNRNYDVDWGNPAGTSNPAMGRASEATGVPTSGVIIAAENCGASAFSEPESQAVRDLMLRLGDRAAFYLSGHTPTHAVITVPAAANPPFQVPKDEGAVLEAELQWIRDHTEYEAGRAAWGNFSAGLPYAASGSSMDYFYSIAGKPSFTVEVEYFPTAITASDYPGRLAEEFEGLRFWMDATVPIAMHLLANSQQLAHWEAPTNGPMLPPDHPMDPLPHRPFDGYLH